MDSARPGNNPSKFLSSEEAAHKMAVSVAELTSWDKQNILKPTVTPDGQTGYTEEQLNNFISDNQTFFQTKLTHSETSDEESEGRPGRAANATEGDPLRRVGSTSHISLYKRFLNWIGGKYYNDDFVEDYMKSQVKDSLSFNFSAPKHPSNALAISVFIVALFIGILSQQSLFKQKQSENAKNQTTTANEKSVLGAQTSKLKLSGNINFRLPLNTQQVSIDKTLEVSGKSVFKSDITAPNVLYGIKAGTGVTITNEASQTPTISVNLATPVAVTSLQGLTGPVTLQEGTNIAINGTTISDTVTLAKLAADGTCSTCILASDVAQNLTIDSSGNVSANAITSGFLNTNVGGTGLTSYNTGDILYAKSSDTLAGLPIGTTDGDILQISNGLPEWSSIPLNAQGSSSTTSGSSLVGVYSNGFTHTTGTNVQTVLSDFDTALSAAGVSPFLVGNDNTFGNFIYPTLNSDNFVLGGNTPETGSLFFNPATANLSVGTLGSTNGTVTLQSSLAGSTSPSLAASGSGDLLIPTGNVAIGTGGAPQELDIDNNPFKLEVHGSIGPDANGVYDLGSPGMEFRNLYITGQTTSGGNITISNPAPEIAFIDTDNSNYQYNIITDNSTFSLLNTTTGQSDMVVNANGDIDFAGGQSSTGCTVTNATGDLTCTGTISGATI